MIHKDQEGIREEINFAIEKSIPVFVVGSVGGCSSNLAEEYKTQNWKGLNNAPEALNKDFADSIDYHLLSQKMLDFLEKSS